MCFKCWWKKLLNDIRDFKGRIINGCLVGMVSICGGCGYYYPGHSIIVSSVAGCMYVLISMVMVKLKIDDPLDAVAVHAGGGMYYKLMMIFT